LTGQPSLTAESRRAAMSGCFLQVGFLALLAPAAVAFDVEGWWAKELAWQSQTPPAFGHAMRAEFDLNASYTNLNQGSYGSTPTKVRHATEALVKLAENNPDARMQGSNTRQLPWWWLLLL
jgi:hypothetical protein